MNSALAANRPQIRYLFSRYIVRWWRTWFGSKPALWLKWGAGAHAREMSTPDWPRAQLISVWRANRPAF